MDCTLILQPLRIEFSSVQINVSFQVVTWSIFKTILVFIVLQTCRAIMANWRDKDSSPYRLTDTERKMERDQMRTVPFKMLVLQDNI